MLNSTLPSFYIARGCYRFSQRGWANFWRISSQFGRTVKFQFAYLSLDSTIPCLKPCSAVPDVENCTSMLVPAFKEKSCPGKVGHPPNRVNFSEPLHEKIIEPFSRANARAHALFVQNSTRACSDCLALTKLTRLGEPKCFYGEMLARLGGRPHHRKRVTQLARRD